MTETPIGQMVDGNTDRRINKPIITMMSCIKIVTEAIEKKNKRSKRDKNSYPGHYHIHINTDAFVQHTTKFVVFFEEDYKIHTIP